METAGTIDGRILTPEVFVSCTPDDYTPFTNGSRRIPLR